MKDVSNMTTRSTRLASVALTIAILVVCASAAHAVDGIAIATRRKGRGDLCFGVGRSVFGALVRHDIEDSRVVKSGVIYRGRARAACINHKGDKVAFLKLDGRVCVIGIDGKGFREFTNARNHNGSAMDWPIGDWVYYTQEARPPRGGYKEIVDTDKKTWGQRLTEQLRDQKTIRRVNVITGEDELVGSTSGPIWQLYLTANAKKGSGKFATTCALMDFSDPGRNLNRRGLACGSGVSYSGNYVFEIDPTTHHDHLRIWPWDQRRLLKLIRVNQWRPTRNDGRKHFYRPRWAVNSDKWLIITHGTDSNCGYQSNMVLYNWMDEKQIQVTNNPLDSNENDEGEDFWVKDAPDAPQVAVAETKPQDTKPQVTELPKPRKKLPPIDVRARLLAVTKTPAPEAIAPYSDALVVCEYEVDKVLTGTYSRDKLRVAHWGMLDLKKTAIARAGIGDALRLVVSPFQDHPDLAGQFVTDALTEDYDLELYYSEVSFPAEAKLSFRVQGLLKKLSSRESGKSAIAALSLGRLFASGADGQTREPPGEVIEALWIKLRALSGSPKTWAVRRACARALGTIGAKATVEPLTRALEDSNLEVVIAATEALGGILAEDEMKKLVRDRLNGVGHARSAAARYLAADPKADDLEWLVTGLYADDWRARKHCAAGIAKLVRGGAPLTEEACLKLTELLGDDTLNVINAAQDALVAAKPTQVIETLVEAAQITISTSEREDNSWRIRKGAIESLGRIGIPHIEEHLPVILAGLSDSDNGVSTAAQRALARIQLDEFYPQLLKEFEKTQTSIGRANILDAMGRRVPKEYRERTTQLALEALHEAEEGKGGSRVRAATISLLGILGSHEGINEIVKHIADREPVVRAASFQALMALDVKDEQKAEISALLIPGLSGADWRRVLAAARALRYFPSTEAIEPLIGKGLGHGTVNVQKAAEAALATYAADDGLKSKIEDALLKVAADGPQVWEYGAKLFGRLKTKRAAKLLADMILAERGEDHWRTQANAANALAVIGAKSDEVEMALVTCIQSEVRQVCDAGERAINRLWPEN